MTKTGTLAFEFSTGNYIITYDDGEVRVLSWADQRSLTSTNAIAEARRNRLGVVVATSAGPLYSAASPPAPSEKPT